MNDGNEKRRIRGSNFTPEEELELVQNIINFQQIIESKELNASTRNEKDAAWNHIAQIFNSKFAPRTTHQLRSKYDNMKTLARRFVAEKRNNIITYNSYAASSSVRSNIAMNIVLAIVTGKTENNENIINCNPDDLHFSEESGSFSDSSTKPNKLETKIKNEENSPINLQVKSLIVNTPAEINKNLERVLPTIPQMNEEKPDSNSTNTSPKKRTPRFQELLRVKTLYLKRKMQLMELENEERLKRMKREEELYSMQMKILMLDASIKQEELKNLKKLV